MIRYIFICFIGSQRNVICAGLLHRKAKHNEEQKEHPGDCKCRSSLLSPIVQSRRQVNLLILRSNCRIPKSTPCAKNVLLGSFVLIILNRPVDVSREGRSKTRTFHSLLPANTTTTTTRMTTTPCILNGRDKSLMRSPSVPQSTLLSTHSKRLASRRDRGVDLAAAAAAAAHQRGKYRRRSAAGQSLEDKRKHQPRTYGPTYAR